MQLSDEERQRLRAEEYFRAEVRKELASPQPPKDLWARLSSFFESKVGFWLLTTVLAGLAAWGFTNLSNWMNRVEIAEARRADRGRQEFETVVKIVPMVTSEKSSVREIGLGLLNGLASTKSIQPETATQITATLQSIVTAGVDPNASVESKTRLAELARLVDVSRTAGGAAVASGSPSPQVGAAVEAVELPARVYIQYGADSTKAKAEAAMKAFRDLQILAPGIERVRNVPNRNELRYCDKKAFDVLGDDLLKAARASLGHVQATHLPASMCGKVRPNHFELWIANPG